MALVGRVARPHGIRGQVIVNPDTDFPQDRFAPEATLFVRRGPSVQAVTIATVRFQQGRPVIGLRGVDSVEGAQAYAGAELRVPVDWLVPLPDGGFYRHDLVGCVVVTNEGGVIGRVAEVEGSAGATRLVVQTDGGEVLIPLATEICVAIDTAARRIVVVPPEGLLTLNAADARGSRAERRQRDRTARARRGAAGGKQPDAS